MERGSRTAVLVLLAVLLACHVSLGDAKKKKAEPVAQKSDVKYIKCEVCEEIAKQLTRQLKRKKDEVAPKKVTEFDVIEMTEKICDLKKNEGEWMSMIDVVEKGDALKLVEQSSPGECNSECKTIQKTCEEVMGDRDTDIAEALYSDDLSRSALSQLLCRKLTKSCGVKVPPVPKDRAPGEKFVPVDAEKAKMDRMLKSMNVKPSVFHDVKDEDLPNAPKMKMYSRDELKDGLPGMKSGDDDDDDDEDEEDEAGPKVTVVDEPAPAKPATGTPKKEVDKPSILKKAAEVAGSVKDTAQQALEAAKKGTKAATEWVGNLMAGDKKGADNGGSSEL